MKLFISLVLFWFCQVALGAVTITANDGGNSATCSISDSTITPQTNGNTVTYTFKHIINFKQNVAKSSNLTPRCKVQFSPNTKTSDLIGGWKFQAKTLDDINFSTSASTCSTLTTIPNDFSLTDIPGITAKSIQASGLIRSNSCQFTVSYSIVLVNDPNSTPSSTILLNPLINFGIRDGVFGSPFAATSLDISFATATPDPSPQSTCSLSVPSNISLGNARPDSFVSGVRVNAKDFTIAVNCSKPISNTFIPNVQMTFGSTFGVTCFAQNMATGANAATNVFIDIFRNDTSQTVCPKTATVPTTLVFKQNTTPTVSYSDNLTLRAAFVNANFPSTATPGIFTTTATFTITFP